MAASSSSGSGGSVAASAPSYHGLPLTMAHRSKRIILLLDASFGFGVTLVFNEVIDFLRQLGVASNSSEDRSHEYAVMSRSEEHTSELQSQFHLVCRLLLEK